MKFSTAKVHHKQPISSIWHNGWYMIPTLLFIIGCLTVTWLVPYSDEMHAINAWREEPLNTFFRFVTHLGDVGAWGVVIPIVFIWRPRYGLMLLLGGLMLLPLVWAMKDLYEVDRPITFFKVSSAEHLLRFVPNVTLNAGYTSFPSGHSLSAFALSSLLTKMLQDRWPPIGLLLAWTAILVAVSRVFLVQHFVVDILFGALFGLLLADLIWQVYWALYRFWTKRRIKNTEL
jgi:membrane-associated phospholipid phosphatase